MAGQNRDTAQDFTSSKKRKHIDDERAERKKKKKQKHVEVEHTIEVSAEPKATKTPKKKKERMADIELLDIEEQNAEAPPSNETPAIPKRKKKRKALAEDNIPQPAHATTSGEDIELPDAQDEDINTASTAQHTTSFSMENTPFHTTRASLYVPCPAISLTTALPSLISTHLTPLLLTYYSPLSGIILSIDNVTLSSRAANEPSRPLLLSTIPTSAQQVALCADTDGVSFIWLSFTVTTFSPSLNTTLSGHINITSEGFIGLVLYNYFQVGIPRKRIPRDWRWIAPGGARTSKKQAKKGRIRDSESEESSQVESTAAVIPDSQGSSTQDTGGRSGDALSLQSTGYWTRADGSILKESEALSFNVVNCDVVHSSTRHSDRMALQIEGTLLDEEEEERILSEERTKFERAQDIAHRRKNSPGSKDPANTMSGGLGMDSREGSVVTTVRRHRVAY